MRLTICSSSRRLRASFSNSSDQCRVWLRGLHGDVGAMGTSFRPIGRQSGRAGHAGSLLFCRPIADRAAEGDDGHGPGGSGRAELFRPAAEPCA